MRNYYSYAVIMRDGPLGMSRQFTDYISALHFLKLLSDEGRKCLQQVMEIADYDLNLLNVEQKIEIDAHLLAYFKDTFNQTTFEQEIPHLAKKFAISNEEEFINIVDFCHAEQATDSDFVDWTLMFSEFAEMLIPPPMRADLWQDEHDNLEFEICPIKIGDVIQTKSVAIIDHLCALTYEQEPLLDAIYDTAGLPFWEAPAGVTVKVDAVKSITFSHTHLHPRAVQIYAIKGHIMWEALDDATRQQLYLNLDWATQDDPLGAGIVCEYVPDHTDMKIIETGDGRDFNNPTKMVLKPDVSPWTIEVHSHDDSIQSLVCLIDKADPLLYPNIPAKVQRNLPVVRYTLVPNCAAEMEEYLEPLVIFAVSKSGNIEIEYITPYPTTIKLNIETKTLELYINFDIIIYGDNPHDYEIEADGLLYDELLHDDDWSGTSPPASYNLGPIDPEMN